MTMRAAVRRRWGGPRDVIELVELPEPEAAANEVVVRVQSTSINRSDYYALGGVGVLMRPMIGGFRRPKSERLGGDFAGVVESVGTSVTDFEPGDEVYGARGGAFAELVAVESAIARKPVNMSFDEAAAVPVAALTALQALRNHGQLVPQQRVLVNGASGGVGTFAVQLAKALGAGHVTAVCSGRNVERVRSLGADRVLDYAREDYTRDGEQYDLVIDVAGSRTWRANRRILAPAGRLVLVGLPSGNHLTGPLGGLARRWLSSHFGSQSLVFFICKPNRDDLELMCELIEAGKVRAPIDHVYALTEIAAALETMGEGHVQTKLVVRLD